MVRFALSLPILENPVMAPESTFSVKPYQSLREKLAQRFEEHAQVASYLRRNTAVIDKFVRDCAKFAKLPSRCSLAALGGYGRREMFPYSDIDVAVLIADDAAEADLAAISDFVTMLWSLGLTVGSNVRTKAEMLKVTSEDITAATAFLEARWLWGDKALFEDTYRTFMSQLDSRMFFRNKMLEMRQRHQKYGDTPYALEPNIKEGLGGLRDLQVFLWYSKAAGYGRSWKEMAQAGLITNTEAYHFSQCLHFLQELRIRLHLTAGRHEDRLIFDVQTALAKSAGYRPKGALLPSEALMFSTSLSPLRQTRRRRLHCPRRRSGHQKSGRLPQGQHESAARLRAFCASPRIQAHVDESAACALA